MGKEFSVKYNEVKHVNTVKELLDSTIKENENDIAYKYLVSGEVKTCTFKEFYNKVQYLGTALLSLDLSKEHVGMIGQNSFEYLVVYLTMVSSSGVFVPIDKELPETDFINILKDSESKAIFYDVKYEAILKKHESEFENIQYFICIQREEDDGKYLSFQKLMQKGQELYEGGNHNFWKISRDPMTMALLSYTSGTTGIMKGVMLSEHNIISCACYGLEVSTINQTGLSVLPYNHTYEAVAGVLVALIHHSTLCINDNIRHVLKNMQLFKPDYIYLVPAFAELFYKKIMANAVQTKKDHALNSLIKFSNFLLKFGIDKRKTFFKTIHNLFGGNLQRIICGGAPIRPEVGDFFRSIGIPLSNGYGITECSPLVSVNQDHNNDPKTVGIPLRCVQIKIDNKDVNGIGEICVKGDTVMLGYFKQPELTNEVMSKDGWFNTGDFGTITEHGQLMITGRKKNLIVLDNGKNIFPEELEGYLSNIPYVQEVLVFGIKNEIGVEYGIAAELYVPQEKIEEFGIKDLEKTLKEDIYKETKMLPSYKQILKFYLRPIPFEKTTTNKLKRSSLMFNN